MANQISTPYRYCHLYHIQDGDTAYHLTDFDVDVSSPGVEGGAPAADWESYAVTHGEVRHELTLDNFDFAIYLSAAHPISSYLTIPLVNTIYITVYEALVNGRAVTGSRIIYRGWCVGVAAQVDSGQVQVLLKPVNLGESEGFPKHSITARCRWMFGSPECGMALQDIEVETEIVRAWPYTMLAEIAYASSFEDRFSGGILKIGGVNVNILRSSATEGDPNKTILSLAHSPVDENGEFIIQPGAMVTARFGCRKTRGACVYHGNIANFGGFPFVPLANPALGGAAPRDNDLLLDYPSATDPSDPGAPGVPGDPYSGSWGGDNGQLSAQIGCFLWDSGRGHSHPFFSPYFTDSDRENMLTLHKNRGYNRFHIYAINDDNYSERRGGTFWTGIENRAVFYKGTYQHIGGGSSPIAPDNLIPMPEDWKARTIAEDREFWIKWAQKIRDAGMNITVWLWPNDGANTINNASRWSDTKVADYMGGIIDLFRQSYAGRPLADEFVLKLEADDEWSLNRINAIAALVKPKCGSATLYYHNQTTNMVDFNGIDWSNFDGIRFQNSGSTPKDPTSIAEECETYFDALPSNLLLYGSEYTINGFTEGEPIGDAIIALRNKYGARLKGVDCGATVSKWQSNSGQGSGQDATDPTNVFIFGDLDIFSGDGFATGAVSNVPLGGRLLGATVKPNGLDWDVTLIADGTHNWATCVAGGNSYQGQIWIGRKSGGGSLLLAPFQAYQRGTTVYPAKKFKYLAAKKADTSKGELKSHAKFQMPSLGETIYFMLSTTDAYKPETLISPKNRTNIISMTWAGVGSEWNSAIPKGPVATNVMSWPQTITLNEVKFGAGRIDFPCTKATAWEEVLIGDPANYAVGNWWIIQNVNGAYYCTTMDYFRQGSFFNLYVPQIFQEHLPPHDTAPAPMTYVKGATYGLFVTTLARQSYRSTNERSNIMLFTMP